MAPECVHNKESTSKSDMFSLGCLLYQLYYGLPPFQGKSEYIIYLQSTKADYCFPADILPIASKKVIESLIIINPKNRPSIEEILANEDFFSSICQFTDQDYKLLNLLISTLEETEKQKGIKESERYKFICNQVELKYITFQEGLRERFCSAKELNNSYEKLIQQYKMQSENGKIDNDLSEKINLLVIHLTNYERTFNNCFKQIELHLEKETFLYKRIEYLKVQMCYEVFGYNLLGEKKVEIPGMKQKSSNIIDRDESKINEVKEENDSDSKSEKSN